MTYKLELTKERLDIHIKSMDSAIRLLGAQLSNSQNGPLALKQTLPDLIKLNEELMELDKLIDSQTEKPNA